MTLVAANNSASSFPLVKAKATSYFTVAVGTTPVALDITAQASAALSTRLAAYAGVYSLIRCTRIFLRVMTPVISFVQIVAFHPGSEVNTPGTFASLVEFSNIAMLLPGVTVPSVLTVSRRELMQAQNKWYSIGSTTDTQGKLWFGQSSSTGTMHIQAEFSYEFCSPTANGYEMRLCQLPPQIRAFVEAPTSGPPRDQPPTLSPSSQGGNTRTFSDVVRSGTRSRSRGRADSLRDEAIPRESWADMKE